MTPEEKMLVLEKERKFDEHVNDIDYDKVIEVDENFPYIKRGFFLKLKTVLDNIFIIKPLTFYLNKIKHKTKVYGRENLKGVKQAMFTCNHVDLFDCLVVRGLVKRKLRIVAASFNNMKGAFGGWMRSGGMMPLSDHPNGMKKFNEAIKYYIERNNSILIYPETAMWHHYRKPRPHKVGAYHYAVKYNIPIVPLCITFREKDKFVLHIKEPIYPNQELDKKTAAKDLMEKNMEIYKKIYEEFYKTELKYED